MRKPKTNDQTERWVKQQVRKILVDTGWYFWMPSADIYGRSGVSDFLAVKEPGLFIAIETKYNDVPTAQQLEFIKAIHAAEHYAFLVDETNINHLRTVLEAYPLPMHTHPEYVHIVRWQQYGVTENLDI